MSERGELVNTLKVITQHVPTCAERFTNIQITADFASRLIAALTAQPHGPYTTEELEEFLRVARTFSDEHYINSIVAELRRVTRLLSANQPQQEPTLDGPENYSCPSCGRNYTAPPSGVQQEPYGPRLISYELEATALGHGYHGNALRVAKDLPCVNDEDRALLDKYATGRNASTDHMRLQELAIKIRNSTAPTTGIAAGMEIDNRLLTRELTEFMANHLHYLETMHRKDCGSFSETSSAIAQGLVRYSTDALFRTKVSSTVAAILAAITRAAESLTSNDLPQSHVRVPVEPTIEMLDAAVSWRNSLRITDDMTMRGQFAECYRVMLRAAAGKKDGV